MGEFKNIYIFRIAWSELENFERKTDIIKKEKELINFCKKTFS